MLEQNPDKLFYKILDELEKGISVTESDIKDLRVSLESNLEASKRNVVIRAILKEVKSNKRAKILDYGSGGGQTVIYLRLLGYNCFGVCLSPEEKNNNIAKKMGIALPVFTSYDGESPIPYEDKSFDFLFSEQVLEHVHNLENYYFEASRVLKDDGKAYFSFPQFLIPFDTHTRKWFIHYLPKRMRDFIYPFFDVDTDYINLVLNFSKVKTHKEISLKYFKSFLNLTPQRLYSQSTTSLLHYEGNRFVRSLINKSFHIPVLGKISLSFFSRLTNIDVLLLK